MNIVPSPTSFSDSRMESNTTPGPGPDDPSILKDQDNHISSDIWDGKERGVLRCLEHTSILDRWKLTGKQIELTENAGFGYLRLMPAITLDCALISALVERWRKETNTFHFTVGEMTITLEDVALLLGLPIDGKPIIDVECDPKSLCETLLGKAPPDFKGAVKLTWLKEVFSECPKDAPIEEIEYCTRAYLLYLVGSTIFSTTSGNKVSVMYLSLFKDFEEAGKYAWGAAALAFLYRALGNASLKSQRTISGSLTLLQTWSYYRLNLGRPKLKKEPENCFPFVLKWTDRSSSRMGISLASYRKALDSLQPCDVEWLPYKDIDFSLVPEDIKTSLILRASRTMLICFDKAERHLPDRCLRQFGMAQPIPEEVTEWKRKISVGDSKEELSLELKEWYDRFDLIETAVEDVVDEQEYQQWYQKVTRRFVGRDESWESRFRQTIKAMHEIVKIVNAFSTDGMNREDKKLFNSVKTMVQECWMDKYGDSRNDVDSVKRTPKRGGESVKRTPKRKREI